MKREIGEHKRSFGVVAAAIASLCLESVRNHLGCGNLGAYDKIAELTDQFEEEHKDVDWEENDFEETIFGWVCCQLDSSPTPQEGADNDARSLTLTQSREIRYAIFCGFDYVNRTTTRTPNNGYPRLSREAYYNGTCGASITIDEGDVLS